MDYQQRHIRQGYEFAVMNARIATQHGYDCSFWMGQISGLSAWANAAPRWECAGHLNEIRFLRGDYARRHSA